MTPLQQSTAALAGILGRRVRDVPFAVLDFETTGLRAGIDRVVETAIVRVDPGQGPRLVFDTLINPGRPMDCTAIHGITDEDVRHAPTFADVAGDVAAALEGCIVAAYNAAFDARFLNYEMANAGCRHRPPYLCLMYLRPLLGIGVRCRLEYACRVHRIERSGAHVAAGDALAAAQLVEPCLAAMDRLGIETYGELTKIGRYRFLESFVCAPISDAAAADLRRGATLRSRNENGLHVHAQREAGSQGHGPLAAAGGSQSALGRASQDYFGSQEKPLASAKGGYWGALQQVASEANLSEADLSRIRDERARSGLKADELRAMHARLFGQVIQTLVEIGRLGREDVDLLRRTRERLSALGWAPGD